MLTKQQCRDLAPKGYEYCGQWDDHYHFQSGGYAGSYDYENKRKHEGFYYMACRPEDMEPRNLALMAKMRLSRVTN